MFPSCSPEGVHAPPPPPLFSLVTVQVETVTGGVRGIPKSLLRQHLDWWEAAFAVWDPCFCLFVSFFKFFFQRRPALYIFACILQAFWRKKAFKKQKVLREFVKKRTSCYVWLFAISPQFRKANTWHAQSLPGIRTRHRSKWLRACCIRTYLTTFLPRLWCGLLLCCLFFLVL